MPTIQDVLDKVNEIKRNNYSTKLKVGVLSDVDCRIRSEIDMQFSGVEYPYNSEGYYALPEGISFDDIDSIYFDNTKVDKMNFKGFGASFYNGTYNQADTFSVCRIIYKVKLDPYRCVTYAGLANQITITTDGIRDYLTTTGNDFENLVLNDTITTTGFTNAANNKTAIISKVNAKKLEFPAGTFVPATESAAVTITRVLNDILLLDRENAEIYTVALMAKLDSWDKEWKSYNNNAALYNQLWNAYQNSKANNRPVDPNAKVLNIWG